MDRGTKNRWLRLSYLMWHGIYWVADRTWHEWLGGAIFVLGVSAALVVIAYAPDAPVAPQTAHTGEAVQSLDQRLESAQEAIEAARERLARARGMRDGHTTGLGLVLRWDAVECCGRRMEYPEALNFQPWQGSNGETIMVGRCPTCRSLRKSIVEFDESGVA